MTTSTQILSAGRTRWVRTDYRVRDGYVEPIPGAALEEYDPCAVAMLDAGKTNAGLLYLQLVDLVRQVEQGRLESSIAAFASQWGLLGLLQHEVQQVSLRIGVDEEGDTSGAPIDLICGPSDVPGLVSGLADELRLWNAQAAIWDGTVIQTTPLEPYLRRYLPSVVGPDDDWRAALRALPAEIPAPLLIWHYLAEPVEMVLTAASDLRACFELAAEWVERDNEPDLTRQLEIRFGAQLVRVHASPHFGGANPAPGAGPNGGALWQWGWAFPSLLSVAYGQLFMELQAGQKFRFCENPTCKRAFTTSRGDRLYCSGRCRNTVVHRTYRERLRQAPQVGQSIASKDS